MDPWKLLPLVLIMATYLLSGCASSAIHDVSSSGNLSAVKSYVEGGGDLENRGDKNWVSGRYHYAGKTPLHMAVENNQSHVVRYLMEKGADIEAKTSAGETPLILSAKSGNIHMFDLLLSYSATRFAVDENGNTSLMAALDSLKEQPEKAFAMATFLIQRKADVHATNRWGRTPLHLAAQYDLESVARVLIQYGANINALNNYGESPLFLSLKSTYFSYKDAAYQFKRSKTFEYLVQLEQNFNVKNKKGRTLLHRVCYPEYVNMLMDKNAPKELADNEGETPVFFAIEHCPVETVAAYIRRGFDVKSTGVKGKTVTLAALNNVYFRQEMLNFVIENGADVTQQDSVGRSAIHQAGAHSPDIIDAVIRHGGDINARTKTNSTPLHVAASLNLSQLMGHDFVNQRNLNTQAYHHLLNKPGIQINVRDVKGCTPLHRAVNSNSLEKIKLLLEKGADFNIAEDRGHTPMDMAALSKKQPIIDIFKQYGARPNMDFTKSYGVLCAYP